ncbi:hypothetical protein PENVUL_c002G05021 [Penicillium vulpinum]|uniref:Uncharacterized protein n=1 Tax=Penicillium vulpinum TaxID=29845 RepID=A0A1V6SCW2_9EURO|nr:hypothetical protein PENVUL_c002G05021 [Penicillium vulpinum]
MGVRTSTLDVPFLAGERPFNQRRD